MAGSDQTAVSASNEARQLRAIMIELIRDQEEDNRRNQETNKHLEEMKAEVNELRVGVEKMHMRVRHVCEALRQKKAECKAS